MDTEGEPVSNGLYYSEGGKLRMYMQRDSRMMFTLVTMDTVPSTLDTIRGLQMSFAGETAQLVDPIAYDAKDLVQNFYMAHCGAGVEGVTGWFRVIYENVYPYIDVHFYHGLYGEKIAIVMHPGADPQDVLLDFEGQDSLGVDAQGALRFYLGQEWIALSEAVAYQVTNNNTVLPVNWNAEYEDQNGTGQVSFNFGSYNTTRPLIFQIGPPPGLGGGYDLPGMCWSTLFGGDGYDHIRASTTDNDDNYYVAGKSGSAFMTFPPAPGITLATLGEAAFVCQLNDQDQMQWKTFIGGNAQGDISVATSLAIREGAMTPSIYMAGTTNSATFSTAANSTAYYDDSGNANGGKGFLARFSAANNGQRIWSTYFGDEDLQINGLRRSDNGYLYVVGTAYADLPDEQDTEPNGAADFAYGGNGDAFICRLNQNDRTDWCTYMGGGELDAAAEVVVDESAATVIVAGTTYSSDLQPYDPGGGAYTESYGGQGDAFLFEYTLNGAPLWSTYFGVNAPESVGTNALAIDPTSGDLVIGGSMGANAGLVPVPGPNWHRDTYPVGTNPGYLARFSGTNRGILWATYVPNNNSMDIYCLLFDGIGNLFVGSQASHDGAPYVALTGVYDQPAIVWDILNGNPLTETDMHIMCFTPDQFLSYASYFGGQGFAIGGEVPFSLVKRFGNLYVAGQASQDAPYTWYFPLDDGTAGGGTPYFEPVYKGGYGEGFIAAVCTEALTAVNGVSSPNGGFSVSLDHDALIIAGLSVGQHTATLYDATGRIVQRAEIHGGAQHRWPLARSLAEGVYVVVLDRSGTQRVMIR